MQGDFGTYFDRAVDLAARGASGLALLLIPLAVLLAVGVSRRYRPVRAFWDVPVVHRLGGIGGILLGWCLIYADPKAWMFRIYSIFDVQGPWNVDWLEFLWERANPAAYPLTSLGRYLAAPDVYPVFTLVLIAPGLVLSASLVLLILYFRPRDLLVAAPMLVGMVLLAEALTVYLTALLAYALHVFNFWSSVLLIVIIQHYRRMQKTGAGGH